MKRIHVNAAWIGLGMLHAWLGSVHLLGLYDEGYSFEHVWKSIGAIVGCVVMVFFGIEGFVKKPGDAKNTEDRQE